MQMKERRIWGHDIVKNINVKRYFLLVYESQPKKNRFLPARDKVRANTKAGFSSS